MTIITPFLFSTFFKVALLLFYLATVCLSYNYTDENPIRLVSDRLRYHFLDNRSSFLSVPVKAIYQFGDSVSDTGNRIRVNPSTTCAHFPYGETFFHRPTGRCSDGLLIIDFIAKALSLPMIDPYLNKDGNFSHGVNFAVAGATALDIPVLEEKYNISGPTNLSLSVQLGWFKSHIDSYFPDASEKRRELGKGLFVMGEVGGNDYNFAFMHGKPLQSVLEMVPDIIQAIRNATEEIIDHGATQILIPGNFPFGCVPKYLGLFKTNDSDMYDELKCLKEYNRHAEFHNDELQQMIIQLQNDHPNVTIVYLDYYGALKEILEHASILGFDETAIQKACCGFSSDSDNGANVNAHCGNDGVPVCENPQQYISWDGTHFTQQTYEIITKKLMSSLIPALQNVT